MHYTVNIVVQSLIRLKLKKYSSNSTTKISVMPCVIELPAGRVTNFEITSEFYISSQAFHTTQDDLLLINRVVQKNIRK
jgi:hypothetical protein